MNVENVVENAFRILRKDMPGLVESIVLEGSFVTVIQEQYGTVIQNTVLVDFETPMMYNPTEFYNHTQKLYNLFRSMEYWYEV